MKQLRVPTNRINLLTYNHEIGKVELTVGFDHLLMTINSLTELDKMVVEVYGLTPYKKAGDSGFLLLASERAETLMSSTDTLFIEVPSFVDTESLNYLAVYAYDPKRVSFINYIHKFRHTELPT